MAKACPVCGSRKWRKDNVTGNAICEDGHVFQDFRSENLDVDGAGQGLQKRTVHRGPRVTKVQGKVNAEYYQGEDAEYLKSQLFQLMLRYQVKAITEIWSLPGAFEIIVRDLWAYQLCHSTLPAKPGSGDDIATNIERPDANVGINESNDNKQDNEADNEKSDQSDHDDEKSDANSELLEKLSDKSDVSDAEHDEGMELPGRTGRRTTLKASDTLVTLVVALWIIRYPVANVAIVTLIHENKLPYIDFGYTTLVPEEMKKRINRDVMLAVSPQRAPNASILHRQCHRFARILSRKHGVIIPDINLPPIAWHVISTLGGTPSIYAQVIRLLALINANTNLNQSEIQIITRKAGPRRAVGNDLAAGDMQYERTKKYLDLWLPEVSVAAAWVIVMKMAYGLDDRERHLPDGMPIPKAWIAELNRRLDKQELRSSERASIKHDFSTMDIQDIDRYLDACESILLGKHISISDTLFPLLRPSPVPPKHVQDNPWTAFHSTTSLTHPGNETILAADQEPLLFPGEKMRSYKAGDLTGTAPPSLETIVRSAAEVTGVDIHDTWKAVEVFEKRIDNLKPKSRANSRPNSQRGKRRSMG